jgi:epoxyqueuosine reductase
MRELAAFAKKEARALGFSLVGICDAVPSTYAPFYEDWVRRELHGAMSYLARPDALARRADLRGTMADVRSVLVVADEYFQDDPPGVPGDPSRGVIARYARGEDYHDHMKGRLEELLGLLRVEVRSRGMEPELRGLAYVDTGPILERELAQRAGMGWFGKNTMLLHPKRGSYFFLGVLLLNVELPADAPFEADRCGTCRACLDACPTGALLGVDRNGAPVMDARRCISYLTIELKGPIPREFRPGLGNRIFGCDICQEVCPWNRKFAEPASESAYRARPRASKVDGESEMGGGPPGGSSDTDGPFLLDLMGLSDDEFATRFSGSPIKRAKRRGLLRNVAVALGNWGDRKAVPVLARALDDPEPLVRGHAAWALGEILSSVGIPGDGGFEVAEVLLFRLNEEEDLWVEEEIEAALTGLGAAFPDCLGRASSSS